jgi:hypothetical protein
MTPFDVFVVVVAVIDDAVVVVGLNEVVIEVVVDCTPNNVL